MKKFNKTLAIAAFAAISMFSAQTANAAEPVNNTKAVATETTQNATYSGVSAFWNAVVYYFTDGGGKDWLWHKLPLLPI